MKQIYSDVLTITNAAIHKYTLPKHDKYDWLQLESLFSRGRLSGIVFPTICNLPDNQKPNAHYMSNWKQNVFYRTLTQMMSLQSLQQILNRASEWNLHPVVFKGPTLAILYPEPNLRFSNDIDLLFTQEERPRAEKMLTELGYIKVESKSKEHVPVYQMQNGNHTHAKNRTT